jgi:hypothetical protein
MTSIQSALFDSPDQNPQPATDYETWANQVRPAFLEAARTGEPFLVWQIARTHSLPEPPDRDHDWGRLASRLHREGVTRTAGFGLTRDKSSVRRWRGTRAAIDGRIA